MSPCTDVTMELDTFNLGRTNVVKSKKVTFGGKALNVAIGIGRLNKKCIATGFMFENHRHMFEHVLDKEGVIHDFVCNSGDARVNYKIIDKKSMLTEINDRGGNVSREKQLELIEKVINLSSDCDIVVMSGSLPKGVNPEFYGEVLSAVPDGVKIIIDAEKSCVLSAVNKTSPTEPVKPVR